MKRFRFKANPIFIMLLVSIILVTLIPICVLSYVYTASMRTMQEEIEYSTQCVLDQCRMAGENLFNTAENLITSLCFDDRAIQFASQARNYTSAAYAKMITQARDATQLGDLIRDQASILEFGIYSGRNDAIVSFRSGYARASQYLDTSLRFDGAGCLELLNQKGGFKLQPASQVTLYQHTYSALAASAPIFSNYIHQLDGFVYMIIDDAPLRTILAEMALSDNGFCYIVDSEGQILFHTDGKNAPNFDKESDILANASDFFILRSQADSGREYVAYVPKAVVSERLSYIQHTIGLLAACGLGLTLLAAIFIAYRNSKPITEIYEIATGPENAAQSLDTPLTYNFLKGTISELVHSNRDMNEQRGQFLTYSRADFIHRLADGSIFLASEIQARANLLHIDLDAQLYAALILRKTGLNESIDTMDTQQFGEATNFWMLVESVFHERSSFRVLCSCDQLSQMTVLALFPEEDASACAETLKREVSAIARHLSDLYHISLEYICGGLTSDLSNIGPLFLNAGKAPRMVGMAHTGKLLWVGETNQTGTIYYPLYEETRLVKALTTSQRAAAHSLFSRLMANNTCLQEPENANWPILCQALYLTLCRCLENCPSNEELLKKAQFLKSFTPPNSLSSFEKRVHNLLDAIIDAQQSQKESENAFLLQQISEYMDQNLGDSGFTLYNVSERFGIPESTLYRFIKLNGGQSFSALLEQKRMALSARLLLTTEFTIDEIASLSGYNSSHAFRRVFKKIYNMLPTEYRSAVIDSQNE